jgi:hypothetical protein
VTNYAEYLEEYILDVECLLIKSIPDADDWNNFLKIINPKIIHNFALRNIEKSTFSIRFLLPTSILSSLWHTT